MEEFTNGFKEYNKKVKDKILILGGSGFIGKAILHWIKSNNSLEYLVIDKKEINLHETSAITYLDKIIKKFEPTIVLVLAAVKRQDGDSIDLRLVNNSISDNITNVLGKYNIHTIYISSCAVYGEKNYQKNYSELSPLSPTSEYGRHKIYSEKLYVKRIDQKKLLILRPPLIYSIYDQKSYQPGKFVNDALNKGKIELWGEGMELREFINIFDASFIIYKMTVQKVNGLLNLVSGKSFSYNSIASEIQKNVGCKLVFKERDSEIVNHTYASKQLSNIIGEYKFLSPIQTVRLFFGKCRI